MKILLVPDRPGWAFDHKAKDLVDRSSRNFRFALKYLPEVKPDDVKQYDLLYPMSLSIAKKLNASGVALENMATAITSLRVFEKQMTSSGRIRPEFLGFLKRLRGVNTFSDEIVRIFHPHLRVYKTRVGVDHRLFAPPDSLPNNAVFTVGWVGNIDRESYRELKGYDLVLDALKGLNVKLLTRTHGADYVPRRQMVHFYRALDCFVCSSRSEGLPNPVIEAASCGVPIISTRVGIVPELIHHRHNGIIVPREANAIRREVVRLMQHPELRRQMSVRIRKTIESGWTWDLCMKDWEHFFQSIK